ncbi:MAG: hypothetical protein ABGX05_02195 [Pirellulaceae bacterium]
MHFALPQTEFHEQEALASARQSTFQDNLSYLHANIHYYLSLDVDQSHQRLEEISATIAVLLKQRPHLSRP